MLLVLLVEGITVAMGTVIFSIVTAALVSIKLNALASVTMRMHNSFGGTPSSIPFEPFKILEMFLDGQRSFAQNLFSTLPST